jgi:hypothetical protein
METIPKYNLNEEPDIPLPNPHSCLALLQTWRQLYIEGSCIFYQTNTFDVNHSQTLLFLERTMRPHILERIHYLQISFISRGTFCDHSEFYHSDCSNLIPYDFAGSEQDAARYPDDKRPWEEMWDVVTSMAGLQHIKLQLNMGLPVIYEYPDSRYVKPRRKIALMLDAPKAKVKCLRSFELETPESYYMLRDPFGQEPSMVPAPGYLMEIKG